MIFVADKDDGAVFARELEGLEMYFCDQRAGSIDHSQRASLGFIANPGRHAVGAEYQHRAMRNFVNRFDENRAAAAKLLHNVRVMNNFVVYIDRVAVGFERQFHNVYSAYYPCAETSRPHS